MAYRRLASRLLIDSSTAMLTRRNLPFAASTLIMGVALAGAPARADTAVGPYAPNPAIGLGQPRPPLPPEHRSVGAAVALSIAGTAAGIVATAALAHDPQQDPAAAGVGFAFLSFGPSVGELYAGANWRALIFSSARGLCSGAFLYEYVHGHLGGEVSNKDAGDNAAFALLGLFGLTIVSIVDAGIAADDFNRRHRPPPGFGVGVAPLLAPARAADGSRGGLDAGLTLAGHF